MTSSVWHGETIRRVPTWMVGALTAVLCVATVSTAAAETNETCQQEHSADIAADRLAVTTVLSDQMASTTTDRSEQSPCRFDDYDSPSYNVCFADEPRPLSTMPKWLTRFQAEDVVATVFDNTSAVHGKALPSALARPARSPSPPDWLVEIIDDIQHNLHPVDTSDVCLDAEYDENCHNLPSPAVLITAGVGPPGISSSPQFELPWSPGEDEQTQQPLVDLRVGPSIGHDSPPDRPPPA